MKTRICGITGLLLLAIMMCSCTRYPEEQAVYDAFNKALKAGDYETALSYCYNAERAQFWKEEFVAFRCVSPREDEIEAGKYGPGLPIYRARVAAYYATGNTTLTNRTDDLSSIFSIYQLGYKAPPRSYAFRTGYGVPIAFTRCEGKPRIWLIYYKS